MEEDSMDRLCDSIKAIALQAGDIIRSAAGLPEEPSGSADESDLIMSKQGHANYVTQYDRQVQAFLFDALSKLLPDASFVGEEDGKSLFLPAYKKGYTFVVDPIDGTSNFMKGYGQCVTSIGLLRDGAPYLGVIYAPLTDQLFCAVRGQGAFENEEPIHCSSAPLSMSLVTMGTAPYRADLSPQAFLLAAHYMPRCIDIRRSGSAAWDLCMTASGRTGLYFEPMLSLHDYAAGACIAMEAGVTVTDLDGQPLSFDSESSISAASAGVASAPYLPGDLFSI